MLLALEVDILLKERKEVEINQGEIIWKGNVCSHCVERLLLVLEVDILSKERLLLVSEVDIFFKERLLLVLEVDIFFREKRIEINQGGINRKR